MKTLKIIALLLLVLPSMAGCSLLEVNRSKEFTHTGCASAPATKGMFGDAPSLLTLKYEDGDLRVIRTNATLNCAYTEFGMECKVSLEGDVIHYRIEKKTDLDANCVCLVEEMSSVVTGLQPGRKYTFDYCCEFNYPTFSFVFEKGLFQVVDLSDNYAY